MSKIHSRESFRTKLESLDRNTSTHLNGAAVLSESKGIQAEAIYILGLTQCQQRLL